MCSLIAANFCLVPTTLHLQEEDDDDDKNKTDSQAIDLAHSKLAKQVESNKDELIKLNRKMDKLQDLLQKINDRMTLDDSVHGSP